MRPRCLRTFMLCLLALLSFAPLRPALAELNVTGVFPHSGSFMDVDPVRNRLYLSTEGKVEVRDGDSHLLLASISVESAPVGGRSLSVDSVTGRIYLGGETLTVIDGDTHATLADVSIPKAYSEGGTARARAPLLHAEANRLYVGTAEIVEQHPSPPLYQTAVRILDAQDYSILKTIKTPNFVHWDLDSSTGLLYLTGFEGTRTLTVMDSDLETIVASIPLGSASRGITVDSTRKKAYIHTTALGMNVVDLAQNREILNDVRGGVGADGDFDFLDFHLDPASGDLYLIERDSSNIHASWPRYLLRRWDEASVNDLGGAVYKGFLVLPPAFPSIQAVHPTKGRVYVLDSHTKNLLVVEDAPPVDVAAPVVTVTIDGKPNSAGWYRDPVWVSIRSTDEGFGVNYISAKLVAGGESFPFGTSFSDGMNIPFQGSTAGDVGMTLEYTAVDFAGNRESGSVPMKVDTAAPVTDLSLAALSGGIPQMTLTAQDRNSGVEGTFYRVDDGPLIPYSGPVALDPDRPHEITLFSRDIAGNEEIERTFIVHRSGDLGGDGRVTVSDVVQLLTLISLGQTKSPLPVILFPETSSPHHKIVAGDLDGSGELDVSDAIRLLRKIVGL